jgi:hypothetical protein
MQWENESISQRRNLKSGISLESSFEVITTKVAQEQVLTMLTKIKCEA